MLKIYNTLSGDKEFFKSVRTGEVRMYVCGVTVYDYCHLGHARGAIFFDVVRRYLRQKGIKVKYVRNFTDVDDKIINRAKAEGKTSDEIALRFIDEYYLDMETLGVAKADVEPKVTEHIEDIIEMVKGLIDKGYAYEVDGNVYFEVGKFREYGKLSKREKEEMLAGARVEVDERKKDPLDFALWKASKEGEPYWDSPWGKGRPGWHIECSVMSLRHLGPNFDIHGGGEDLIFPHHENEIAQSEAYTGERYVNYWVHNGFVTINREKMSKSLGNFFTIREIIEKLPYTPVVSAEIIRYFLLSTHYKSPIDFSDESLRMAKKGLDKFYNLLSVLEDYKGRAKGKGDDRVKEAINTFSNRFTAAMDNDLNTAEVLGELHKFTSDVNRLVAQSSAARPSQKGVKVVKKVFNNCGNLFGLFSISPKEWPFTVGRAWISESFHAKVRIIKKKTEITEKEIEKLIEERNRLRAKREFDRSDTVRKELEDRGIILEDTPQGTRWKRKG